MNIEVIKERYKEKDESMYGKKSLHDSLALLYHENSKFTSHSLREQGYKINTFNNPYVIERSSQPFKCYPGHKTIHLEPYKKYFSDKSFYQVLQNRSSTRDFEKNYKLSINEIAAILYNAYGVTRKSKIQSDHVNGHIGLRNVPSGGGLYPLEIYIVLFQAHLETGLYHYRPNINSLELVKEGNFMEKLRQNIQAEPYINILSSSAVIITTGFPERMMIKYGERGYRFLLQESGFVGQTISLIAESMEIGSCWVGGYLDDKLCEFLHIDGAYESINNVIILGKPQR